MEETYSTSDAKPSNAILITGIVIAFVFPVLSLLLNGLAQGFTNRLILSRFVFWAEVGFLWLYAVNI